MTFAHITRSHATLASATVLLACALVAAAPAPAFAEGTPTENGSASSKVFLMADTAKIVASVPTQINFMVNGDGTLVAPSQDALAIQNKSVFGIRVDTLKATPMNDFQFVADASNTGAENAVQLDIAPKDGTVTKAAYATANYPLKDPAWSIDRNGSVSVTMSGAVANVTKDLSSNQQFATINWSFAAGKISE